MDMQDEIKKLTRRIDTMQATMDLIYHDREILEDIQASIKELQTKIEYSREHQERQNMLLRAEVHDVNGTVEDGVAAVGKSVEKTIVKEVAKKKVVRVHYNFFNKWRHLFNKGAIA